MDEIRHFDAAVLGAGIGGLTAAYRLARCGLRTALIDPRPRVGGVIESERIGGYLVENGPNSFTLSQARLRDFLAELGLETRLLKQPLHKNDRFIFWNGQLRKAPASFGSLIGSSLMPIGVKIRMIGAAFSKQPPLVEDVTVGAYFRERMGDAVAERLVKPFFAGVYAADADATSFAAAFPKLFDALGRGSSLVGALKSLRPPGPRIKKCLISFENGLSELPAALEQKYRAGGGELLLGRDFEITSRTAEGWQLRDERGGDRLCAAQIVIAAPAETAARLLRDCAPRVAEILRAVEYAPLTIAHAGLAAEQLAERRGGFGFLSAAQQGADALGMIWSEKLFANRAPAGRRLLTCFYGGALDPRPGAWDDAELERRLRADLLLTMGFRGGEFDLLHLKRWERALPKLPPGHRAGIESALRQLPPDLHLLGNYFGGVSITDRIGNALELAEKILERRAAPGPRAERQPENIQEALAR